MSHPAAADIVGLYERNAETWVLQRANVITEQFALDWLIERLVPGATVLDVGCGSGRPVARFLIEHGMKVTGLDSSPSLIAAARRNFPFAEWMVADMRVMDLGRQFDAVVAWYSLFHLTPEDQRPMFARFATHCASGGLLLFPTGDRLGHSVGEWIGEPLYHGSLAPNEYRALLDANGFDVIFERPHEPERGHGITWFARRRTS